METEKLIEILPSASDSERSAALLELSENPPEDVLGRLADLVLSHTDPGLREACFELFERHGAAVSMTGQTADGWFDEVKTHIPQFDAINNVLGDRFLAYSFILGIQIRALMVDSAVPLNTTVHFTLNDEQVQILSLGEFRLRIVQALLYHNTVKKVPALPLDSGEALQLLGPKTLLLAPLFNISVERVLLASLDPASPRYLVAYRTLEGAALDDLDDFLEQLRSLIRQDVSDMTERSVTIDLSAVETARRAAEEGEPERVIALLASWPGWLAALHRTPVSKQLPPDQLSLLGEGVCLLGEALEKVRPGPWIEELYKLGLMMVREGTSAGRLCWNLGRVKNDNEEFGVAIGLLRRALALGAPEEQVLPALGRAFLKQGKVVAAAALLEVAAARGMTAPDLEEDLSEARQRIREGGGEWRVPVPGEGA